MALLLNCQQCMLAIHLRYVRTYNNKYQMNNFQELSEEPCHECFSFLWYLKQSTTKIKADPIKNNVLGNSSDMFWKLAIGGQPPSGKLDHFRLYEPIMRAGNHHYF